MLSKWIYTVSITFALNIATVTYKSQYDFVIVAR